ncbi:MAG: AMP-binding protein [Kiritimatiellia bacterium]|nr:AMP-binding protein [Kiritimatiellia bacterium]
MTPNPELAFQPPDRIAEAQRDLLRSHVAYCRDHSPFYRSLLKDVNPEALEWDSLPSLPLTDKTQLALHNAEFLAAPRDRIADLVFSSGTTGEPVQMMYTREDLRRLAYNESLAFSACGIQPGDTGLLTCTLDRCFIAGLAYFLGGCERGATMIRNGHGTMESHEIVLQKTRPTLLVGVPSFLRKLGTYLQARGMDLPSQSVRKLVCIGEPLRNAEMALTRHGAELESLWGANVYSTYASSETITTFCECTEQRGGHLHPDLGMVEIVDDDGRVLPIGSLGEIVVTPLQMEGMPLIRFRTGDISFLLDGPCPCGRRTPRLGPILGRKNQMMKVQGTTLYPPAVFAALDEWPGVLEYRLIVRDGEDLSDRIALQLAFQPGSDDLISLKRFLQARLRVIPEMDVKSEAELQAAVFPPGARKPVRFVDQRG